MSDDRERESKIIASLRRRAFGEPSADRVVSIEPQAPRESVFFSAGTDRGDLESKSFAENPPRSTESPDESFAESASSRLSPETLELMKKMTAKGKRLTIREFSAQFASSIPDEQAAEATVSKAALATASDPVRYAAPHSLPSPPKSESFGNETIFPPQEHRPTLRPFGFDESESRRSGRQSLGTPADHLMVVTDLHKGYVKGKNSIPVLRGINLDVKKGEYLSVVGQSGSGKSTLLHLMGTLDAPDCGTVHFDGQRIDNLPSPKRDVLRNRYIGMIFQFYHLIPEMTMIENVLAPLMIRESIFGYFRKRRSYHAQAKEILERVGLGHRIRHRPNELSGGEMQRTAIARALITEPRVLLADEPTGNLDSRTATEIVSLLRSLNRERKLTIVMVTHDTEQAREADRYIRLIDGQVAETVVNHS